METYGKSYGKFDLERFGYFSEPSYLHGRGYDYPITVPNIRDTKGRQMIPGYPKWKVGLQDCYFDQEFKRVFVHEGYTTPFLRDLKERNEKKSKNIAPQPFYPSAYPKKPACPGDHYGTFSGIIPEFSPLKNPKPPVKKEPRGIFTNPGKKGNSGYKDITIGKYPEYQSDKYYVGPTRESMGAGQKVQPFRTPGKSEPYLDPNPYFTSKPEKPYKTDVEVKYTAYGTFFPNSPTKWSGGSMQGNFSKWPPHADERYVEPRHVDKILSDNLTARLKRFEEARKMKPSAVEGRPKFAPQASMRTAPTMSVMNRNVEFRTHAKNFRTRKPVTFTREFLN